MKVFISWSGTLSNKLAETFRNWLPGALQNAHPYFTPSDIEKGARWNSEISKELEASDVGVLFITRDNIGSAWLLYEAGALSKRLDKSRVCPVVFGLAPNDLPGPLRQFQATEFKDDDFKKLLKTINSTAGENKLSDQVLDQVFEMWWPRLKGSIEELLRSEQQPDNNSKPLRQDREILEELLELTRLNTRRISRSRDIAPSAIIDLIGSIKDVNSAIQGETDPQLALDSLKKMMKPIEYLATHARDRDGSETKNILQSIEELSFEYISPEDEIPF